MLIRKSFYHIIVSGQIVSWYEFINTHYFHFVATYAILDFSFYFYHCIRLIALAAFMYFIDPNTLHWTKRLAEMRFWNKYDNHCYGIANERRNKQTKIHAHICFSKILDHCRKIPCVVLLYHRTTIHWSESRSDIIDFETKCFCRDV